MVKKPSVKLMVGSCFDILPTLQENSIDCVITDPPYSGFDAGNSQADYFAWLAPLFKSFQNICKASGGIAVSQPPSNHEYIRHYFNWEADLVVKNAFADDRQEGAHFLALNLPSPPSTFVATNEMKLREHLFPKSIHPNARNITKMASIVQLMSKPGETVLDPFCGSAAIGIACVLLGRNYVGIELYPKRADDARKRLLSALTMWETTN